MASRHAPRVRCVLPVKVAGTDAEGNRFERLTCTLDISDKGARITGIPDKLRPGMELAVIYKNRRGSFRVAWVGQTGTRTADQIGLISDSKEAEFWPELRKHQSKDLAEDYAERERQAQQHARQAIAARAPVAPSPPPPSAPGSSPSPTERLKAATEEMFELARLIEKGAVEPVALQEFRQALGYVRNTSWMLQQWFELQQSGGARLPLLTMLNSERMRLAASLCNDLSAFLATAKVEIDLGLMDHFVSVVRPLLVILNTAIEKRAESETASDAAGGTRPAGD